MCEHIRTCIKTASKLFISSSTGLVSSNFSVQPRWCWSLSLISHGDRNDYFLFFIYPPYCFHRGNAPKRTRLGASCWTYRKTFPINVWAYTYMHQYGLNIIYKFLNWPCQFQFLCPASSLPDAHCWCGSLSLISHGDRNDKPDYWNNCFNTLTKTMDKLVNIVIPASASYEMRSQQERNVLNSDSYICSTGSSRCFLSFIFYI